MKAHREIQKLAFREMAERKVSKNLKKRNLNKNFGKKNLR